MPETTAKVSGGKNMPASPLVSYVSPPQPYCTPFRIRAEAVVTRRSFLTASDFSVLVLRRRTNIRGN